MLIAGLADNRLHQQAGQRSGQPEDRDLIGARAEIFVDGAHVGHLQAPAELDAEKTEAHVPDLPEALRWLLHLSDLIAASALPPVPDSQEPRCVTIVICLSRYGQHSSGNRMIESDFPISGSGSEGVEQVSCVFCDSAIPY